MHATASTFLAVRLDIHYRYNCMLIRKLLKRSLLSGLASLRFCQSGSESTNSNQKLLEETVKHLGLDLKSSVMMHEKISKRILTSSQKAQLKLFIPRYLLPRMTLHYQAEYCPSITTALYHQQIQHNLTNVVRILQANNPLATGEICFDDYINLTYKDIFARYFISKNGNLAWDAFYADYGFVNPYGSAKLVKDHISNEIVEGTIRFINQCGSAITQENTIGLYSYSEQRDVPSHEVEIERVKKLGYFIKIPLTDFGKFEKQFGVLTSKKQSIEILVFVDNLLKAYYPEAIVLSPDALMCILYHEDLKNPNLISYLITSKEIYKKQTAYFTKIGYKVHDQIPSKHFKNMKAGSIPIISEINDYEGKPGFSLLNGTISLKDFERLVDADMPPKNNFVSTEGKIKIGDKQIAISHPQLQSLLYEELITRGTKFLLMNEIYEDEIYSWAKTGEVLKFRLMEKVTVNTPSNAATIIFQYLRNWNTNIIESKVKLESQETDGLKPRQKRRIRKMYKRLRSQQTDYMAFIQALNQCESISVISSQPTSLEVSFIRKGDHFERYMDHLSQEEFDELCETGIINSNATARIEEEGYQVEKRYVHQTLLAALRYIRPSKSELKTPRILIEPQSSTQDIVATSLHVDYILNQKFYKNSKKDLARFLLVFLHPTIVESQRKLPVTSFIVGSQKVSGAVHSGFGLEAIRLWAASKNDNLGDRELLAEEVKVQLAESQYIRKCYDRILSIVPPNLNFEEGKQVDFYIDIFMLDQINSFILNMDGFYSKMDIQSAYKLTVQFFKEIVEKIYINVIRKKIVAFPNDQSNKSHFLVLKRLLGLLAVINPLFPFSTFHISKEKNMGWPAIPDREWVLRLESHAEMIKLRVFLHERMKINSMAFARIQIEPIKGLTMRDLELFLDVTSASSEAPQFKAKQFKMELSEFFGEEYADQKLIVYESAQNCIRCEPNSKNYELCSKCQQYLEEHISNNLSYYPEIAEKVRLKQ